jgi:hypothetical protein
MSKRDDADDLKRDLLRLACAGVYNLWVNSLIGNPPPCVRDANENMRRVEVGRVVMERSTIWRPESDEARLGRLLRIETRPLGDITEQVFVIEPLMRPGTEFTWSNADFIAVPDGFLAWESDSQKTVPRWRRTPGGGVETYAQYGSRIAPAAVAAPPVKEGV